MDNADWGGGRVFWVLTRIRPISILMENRRCVLGVLTGRPLWSSRSMGSLSSKAWWVTCSSCRAENTKASAKSHSNHIVEARNSAAQAWRIRLWRERDESLQTIGQFSRCSIRPYWFETRHTDSQDDLPLSLSRGRWAIEGQGWWLGRQACKGKGPQPGPLSRCDL